MAEKTMPAAEADVEASDESSHYEFAFHILPTVAEKEVSGVFDELKALIVKCKGEITDEEVPQRLELAYEIREMIEGKYQRFTEAFFGWMRFTLLPSELESLIVEVRERADVLRYLIIKLDRREEENPFRIFQKKEVSKEEPVIVSTKNIDESKEGEVSEKELDKSLKEITS